MKRILLLTISMAIPLLSCATNYEDAEDGNTNGWVIYDNNPAGAAIANVNDEDKNSHVIQFSGTGTLNGFRLGDNAGENDAWNNTEAKKAQWSIKDNGFYKVYISVETENWSGYMYYTPVNFNEGVINAGSTRFIHTGLNLATDGTWKNITRDLQADLHAVEPNNNITTINGFRIKGNGRIDDIKLLGSSAEKTVISLDTLKAFPTAEGAGANATGGRGGDVLYVKNHNASGEGSLRWALSQERPRTILFAVGGRFNVNENIRLAGNHSRVTLAGQTANEIGGVHLAKSNFNICAFEDALTVVGQHDLVFRYFDSRYNWQYLLTNHDISNCPINPQTGQPRDLRGQKLPTLRFVTVKDLIIDHISSGWSSYGLIVTNQNKSNEETGDVTIQHSLMHENIKNPEGQNHNVGMLLGTRSSLGDTLEQWNKIGDFSVHKNAFIGESHRFPNTAGGNNAKFRIINNYIYGFNGDGTSGRLSRVGGNSKNDFVNNVYQEASYGKNFIINDPTRKTGNNLIGFQYGGFLPMGSHFEMPRFGIIERPNFYINGNLFLDDQGEELDITSSIQSDATLMTFRYHAYDHDNLPPRKEFVLDNQHLQLGPRDNLILRNNALSVTDPLSHPVSVLPPQQVKASVLANVGGNVRFSQDGTPYIDDEIDQKYIDWAIKYDGPTKYTTSLTDHDVGSHRNFVYPNYQAGERNLATYDTDLDGMPNTWETEHGLNPNSADGVEGNNGVRTNKNWIFGNYLVKNNAGYTNLEMYLADIGGDFHMLAKEQ